MPNWVTLEDLNRLRFKSSPVSIEKLQRWCRSGDLPARKIGSGWFVDLEQFDDCDSANLDPLVAAVVAKLN